MVTLMEGLKFRLSHFFSSFSTVLRFCLSSRSDRDELLSYCLYCQEEKNLKIVIPFLSYSETNEKKVPLLI